MSARPLPLVDVNPATNPATAALADAAAVKTDPVVTSRPTAVRPAPAERILPKFSLLAEHVEALEQVRRRFRLACGDEENMSRVVAAGIMALASMPDAELVEAIRRIPIRKAGRRPGPRK